MHPVLITKLFIATKLVCTCAGTYFLKGEQAPVDITIYIGFYCKTIFTK